MSHHEPTPNQILFLWRLAATGGEAWKKDAKPDLKPDDRQRLVSAGLILSEKRKPPGGRFASTHLTLTEAGWSWLGSHLDADLSTKSQAGVEVFRLFLLALKAHLERTGGSLGDLLAADAAAPFALSSETETPTEAPAPSADDDGDVAAQATRAYYELSNDRPNVRVRLADLRRRLASVPRAELDRALMDLQVRGEATLFRFDDPREIDDDDREAAIRTPMGEERHILYLSGR